MNLNVPMNNAQQAKLDALLLHGKPDMLVLNEVVNGSPLLVILARGEAKDWIQDTLYSAPPDPDPLDTDPALTAAWKKPVRISTGPRSAS